MSFKYNKFFNRMTRVFLLDMPKLYIPMYILLRVSSWFILKCNKRLLSFSLTPKLPYYTGYEISKEGVKLAHTTVLVLQGPINKYNLQITIDYIKSVKKELGVGAVIYSGPDCNKLSSVCDIVLEPLDIKGPINQYSLQKASTLSGLLEAKKLGYQFVLKLRADSLILRRDAILCLREILESNEDTICVVISHQKPFYQPFMSDHLQFAKTEDLLLLWSGEWGGSLDINQLASRCITESLAPSPEWVLGNSFKKTFPSKNFKVCSDSDIDYVFLKYDFYDSARFDYESVPHFGKKRNVPGYESNIGGVEDRVVERYGSDVYNVRFYR